MENGEVYQVIEKWVFFKLLLQIQQTHLGVRITVRFVPVRLDLVGFGRVWLGLVVFVRVRLDLVRFGQVWSGLVWFDLVWSGLVRLGLVGFGRVDEFVSGWSG